MIRENKLATQIASGVIEFLKKIKKEELLSLIIELLRKEQNLSKAFVYTPITLKELEKRKITNVVRKLTGEKIDSIIFETDESLIDGMKILYKDKLWDFSVSSQISSFLNKN